MWCNSSVWLPSTAGACLQPHGCSFGDGQVIPSPGTTSEPAALGGEGLSSGKLLCPCPRPHPCPPPCKLSSDPSRSGWDAHVCSMGTCLAELTVWTNACCGCSGTWERSPTTSSVSHSHGMLSALCPLPVCVAAGPPTHTGWCCLCSLASQPFLRDLALAIFHLQCLSWWVGFKKQTEF